MTKANECTCPSGDGSLVHPCPSHPAVEQAGGDERDFQAEGAQEVPSPVSQEYDRHLISLLRKGEALPGHQEEAADEIERLRDWNDHLNNTVLPNILNPNFLMLMKGGERLLDLCTKDGKFIGVSLNDMKDVFDWMVTHARIAPDHAALAQPSQAIAAAPTYQFQSREIGESDWAPCDFRWYLYCSKSPEMDTRVVEVAAQPSPAQAEQAEAERPELWAVHAQGPDELYAAFSREDAEKHAAELNALAMPEGITVDAVVVSSPWPPAEHWQYLAEQERDHKNEIAVRLRQFERICEGLPQDAIDGCWTVQGIRCYAKRLEDQLKVALARVAELEKQEPVAWVEVIDRDYGPYNFHGKRLLPKGKHQLYAAPVAQAQHSVPEGFRELLEMLVASDLRKIRYAGAWRREVHDRASSILALLAAAPGQEGV
ncbi:hypothetical protein RDJ20_08230 [Pseudomonas aeruginosa]|uniref:hypothetical protein n=1 Tax=Pseudomonas aeruginosa TaxID=287 RepID=UPI0018C5F3E0|nr:hypothetical protein [Pseudomonas aeruginosa]MBG5299418.1 hypothetical protein [Pseudomonas aeruginosa]MDI3794089.1 hypothetical protein [Pseudomonas aeruginosa]WRH84052.1 hypothetical protein RDJ20_08230 [Pseudomonas aeruginosa]